MYVHRLHQLTDRETLYSLMVSRPPGAVCHDREGLTANQVPFLQDRNRGRAAP